MALQANRLESVFRRLKLLRIRRCQRWSQKEMLRNLKGRNAAGSTASLFHDGAEFIVSIEIVGVDEAIVGLKSAGLNRPLSRGIVDRYASAIQRGEWLLNGEAIVFDEKGQLMQGQHRLSAVVKSGLSITSLVVRGVDRSAFGTFDGGKKRTGADVLSMQGEKNATTVAAALRAIIRIENSLAYASQMTTSSLLASTLERHPTVINWVSSYSKTIKLFMHSSIYAVATLSAEKHGTLVIDRFMQDLQSGAGLTKTNPVYLLRERFINRARGSLIAPDMALALSIKAINAHVAGKQLGVLRMQENEPFPRIV